MRKIGLFLAIAVVALGSQLFVTGNALANHTGLSVEITPAQVSTNVGTPVDIEITVTNDGPTATSELALHVDITDPRGSGSVDPEDWTPTLTKTLQRLGSGQSVTETWSMNPISGGNFMVFATVLDLEGGVTQTHVTVSDGLPFEAIEKRGFNPQGVLPVTLAIPIAIAALLAVRQRGFRFGRTE